MWQWGFLSFVPTFIHSFVFFRLSWSGSWGQHFQQGRPDCPFFWYFHQLLRKGCRGIPRPDEKCDLFSVFWVCHSISLWQDMPERCLGGILTRCPNLLIWLLWIQKSISTLTASLMSELLTLSLMLNPATLWWKLISATCVHNLILVSTIHNTWPLVGAGM